MAGVIKNIYAGILENVPLLNQFLRRLKIDILLYSFNRKDTTSTSTLLMANGHAINMN